MNILELATEIHKKTGMDGKELEAFTFLAAAVFADATAREGGGGDVLFYDSGR